MRKPKSVRTRAKRKPPVGVGVIGLGFMGRTHLSAYRAANRAGFSNQIVAVCDRSFGKGRGTGRHKRRSQAANRGNLVTDEEGQSLFDPESTACYADAPLLFEDKSVDLVSICTHTPTHVELAIAALRAGKHVLVEKPIALSSRQALRLARAARASDKLCLPGMCIRFWPAWRWLKESVHSGKFGPVKSAVFRRVAAHPNWSKAFYGDADVNGGALFDLHIHDADFVRFCFGAPDAVSSSGTRDHLTTLYHYSDGPAHVVAEGGWDLAPGFGFEMNFTVVFESATADFRLGRDKSLVLWKGSRASHPKLPSWNGYDGEVRHLLAAIRGQKEKLDATADEAAALTRMLECEQRSLETGRPVRVGK